MGKRKSRSKPEKKRVEKLETVFTCPFCNYGRNVECRVYKAQVLDDSLPPKVVEKWVGTAECYVCKEQFSTDHDVTHLSEPIDIYSEWIDACEKVNKEWIEECERVNKRYR